MARLEWYDSGSTDAVGEPESRGTAPSVCKSFQFRVAPVVSECIRRGVSESDTHAVLKVEGESVS